MANTAPISNPLQILTTLAAIAAFFFWLERQTRWKLFSFFPPLIFIYALPMIMSSSGVLAHESPAYDWMRHTMLPFMLTIMMLRVDVVSTVKVMGKGVLVMLCGTAGVVLGAPLAYFLVKAKLDASAWKAFGTLAGSWIGGTGNMAAVSDGIEASGTDLGLAVLADNCVYILWLPILLSSRGLAAWFNRFARVDQERLASLEKTSMQLGEEVTGLEMRHVLYLVCLGFGVTYISGEVSLWLPEFDPILKAGSWKILLVTTFGLLLSMTPARKIPCSHEMAMALVYLYVAVMGARADLSGLTSQGLWFVLGAFIWIFMHGALCVLGAWLFHVDIHSTAIASAANVGGAASAPVVAGHHNPRLVPVSVLMAMLGYAIGNYGGLIAAWLCQQVSLL